MSSGTLGAAIEGSLAGDHAPFDELFELDLPLAGVPSP